MTNVTSREFNQETGKAKRAADLGPVFITDRGRPSHVLLSIADYRRLSGTDLNIVDLLAMPGIEDIDFEPPRLPDLAGKADLALERQAVERADGVLHGGA